MYSMKRELTNGVSVVTELYQRLTFVDGSLNFSPKLSRQSCCPSPSSRTNRGWCAEQATAACWFSSGESGASRSISILALRTCLLMPSRRSLVRRSSRPVATAILGNTVSSLFRDQRAGSIKIELQREHCNLSKFDLIIDCDLWVFRVHV